MKTPRETERMNERMNQDNNKKKKKKNSWEPHCILRDGLRLMHIKYINETIYLYLHLHVAPHTLSADSVYPKRSVVYGIRIESLPIRSSNWRRLWCARQSEGKANEKKEKTLELTKWFNSGRNKKCSTNSEHWTAMENSLRVLCAKIYHVDTGRMDGWMV